jgi:hypothetical protein
MILKYSTSKKYQTGNPDEHFLQFSEVFLGATDSALPCALLLDIAKTLGPFMPFRDNKVDLNYFHKIYRNYHFQHITLQLVFLDGEEAFQEWTSTDSIYGARHLADVWERKWYPSSSGSAFELSREIDRIVKKRKCNNGHFIFKGCSGIVGFAWRKKSPNPGNLWPHEHSTFREFANYWFVEQLES